MYSPMIQNIWTQEEKNILHQHPTKTAKEIAHIFATLSTQNTKIIPRTPRAIHNKWHQLKLEQRQQHRRHYWTTTEIKLLQQHADKPLAQITEIFQQHSQHNPRIKPRSTRALCAQRWKIQQQSHQHWTKQEIKLLQQHAAKDLTQITEILQQYAQQHHRRPHTSRAILQQLYSLKLKPLTSPRWTPTEYKLLIQYKHKPPTQLAKIFQQHSQHSSEINIRTPAAIRHRRRRTKNQ